VLLGHLETLPDEIDFVLGRFPSAFRFLLKCMEDVNGFRKSNRVNRTVRIAVIILRDFQDRCASKSFQRSGIDMFPAILSLP
jgi:hypothetical protein